jgi:DNA uptake protein ComE-like DNA-binding protein
MSFCCGKGGLTLLSPFGPRKPRGIIASFTERKATKTFPQQKPMKRPRRSGLVLVLVLVIIALLSISTLVVADRMLSERRLGQRIGHGAQARASADSGVEMAKQFLELQTSEQDYRGGLYDNPQRMRDVLVIDDDTPRNRARFSLVAPLHQENRPSSIRFGLEDESTKINLRTILKADQASPDGAKNMLLALPGMTDAIADAILDWIDEDETPRALGAESSSYSSLQPGYAPRNGPPATIEELLLVRGVTPQLLFGLDAARQGPYLIQDNNNSMQGVDNTDGAMEHGWAAYLTLYSMESNLRDDGSAKINLNGGDLKKLYDELQKSLGDEWATFIVAYRQNGSQGKMQQGEKKNASTNQKLDFNKAGSVTIKTVLDLIGVRTSAKFEDAKENTSLDSPFAEDPSAMSDYLPKLLDNTTTTEGTGLVGRININQAPRVVLSGIPGITSDVVQQILSKRTPDPAQSNADHRHETWLLTEGLVPLEKMKTLMPYINAGGSVFCVQSVGFFEGGGPLAQLEVFLDASKRPVTVLFWRDISHLATGYVPYAIEPNTNTSPYVPTPSPGMERP